MRPALAGLMRRQSEISGDPAANARTSILAPRSACGSPAEVIHLRLRHYCPDEEISAGRHLTHGREIDCNLDAHRKMIPALCRSDHHRMAGAGRPHVSDASAFRINPVGESGADATYSLSVPYSSLRPKSHPSTGGAADSVHPVDTGSELGNKPYRLRIWRTSFPSGSGMELPVTQSQFASASSSATRLATSGMPVLAMRRPVTR
jgi:hypothetical protein